MELLRLFFVIAALWVATALAELNEDVRFPYNCSTRVTCSSLRLRLPVDNEEFNAQLVKTNNNSLTFNLTNDRGDQLVLTITGVQNQRFRIEIEEHDQHRYKLQYSLDKEPAQKRIKVVGTTSGSVTAEDDEGNKVIVKTRPLFIEFYHNNALESVFEGNRLIFENTPESQAFTFSVRFAGANRLLGLHEHTSHLSLKHTVDYRADPYRLRNSDYGVAGFVLDGTGAMYGSIPVIYAFGNATSGIFHHNAAEQWIDIDSYRKSAYFMVDGGRLDLFVLMGPSLKETIRQYLDLTGKPHLPQLWALGYHQSRWAYNSTADVMDVIGDFDKYDFPLDALWLDIEYTSERKWFTWNHTSFPDPVKLLNWVDAQGHRKLVPISDPHMKTDPNYKIYADLLAGGMFINNSDGLTPFVGNCWPGNSSWVDFFNPAAADYYSKLHLYENFPSTPALGGFWNDMNEPTLFNSTYERTVPFDTLHHGGIRHRDVHNIYGMLQTRSTHKGLIARDNGTLRPFILSRAYFAGSQRYACKWSGDNFGIFPDLRYSVPMALTSNLVGLVFYGADIPGFFGVPTHELLIRWYQIAIWIPFFRAHANLGTPRREPFRFDNDTQAILRTTIQLRYKHLPYWYTLFYEHTVTGDPLLRPLLYQYPEDPVGYDLEDEFLLGNDILVASVYESNATSVPIYFPGKNDVWLQVTGNTSKFYQGGNHVDIPVDITFAPVFYRAGGIIARKPNVKRSAADIALDPHELHIVVDNVDESKFGKRKYNRGRIMEGHWVLGMIADNSEDLRLVSGMARTRLYVDDYESFNYVDQKNYIYLEFIYDDASNTLSFKSLGGDPGNLKVYIGTIHIYRRNESHFTISEHNADHAGNPLDTINILKNHIQLL